MNNKLLIPIITVFIAFIFSCNNSSDVIISGTITNQVNDSIVISGPNIKKTIRLNENGNFLDTLNVSSNLYTLTHGRERTNMFLKPGYSLSISIDTKEFDESLTYSGTGSSNNSYLALKTLDNSSSPIDYEEVYSLNEEDFLDYIKNTRDSDLSFLNSFEKNNTALDSELKSIELKEIDYKYLLFIQRYPIYYKFYAKKDPKTSDSFTQDLKNIDYINNNDYISSPSYKSLVLSHFLNQESIDNNINDHFKGLIDSNADDIKKDVVYQGKYSLRASSDNNEVIYNALTALSNDSTQTSELTDLYNKLSVIKKGMKSPEFINYENYKGGTTSLSDLKGKYVYIDVWATWCGPCIREIPSLKKVEKLYHNKNIEFVSISIDVRDRPVYNYDKWRQMIEEKSLGGVQLFADNAWDSKFTKAFVINSIPRFLLIDPDGNIVSGDAPRPSDQKLVELFDSLDI